MRRVYSDVEGNSIVALCCKVFISLHTEYCAGCNIFLYFLLDVQQLWLSYCACFGLMGKLERPEKTHPPLIHHIPVTLHSI